MPVALTIGPLLWALEMSSMNSLPSTEKYLYSREILRARAREEFFAKKPSVGPLISAINDYVSSTTLGLSDQDVRPVPHGVYICNLIVSFVRTHFIILDLVTSSELIEAATLIRKQFELLARLNELRASESINHLLKRTPNLSALKTQLKTLYSDYSEIAHSSHPRKLDLLGSIVHCEKERTVLYPIFLENAYVSLQHVVITVFEYHMWAHQFLSENFKCYDVDWGAKWMFDALEKYKVTYGKGDS